jgi:ABC-type multidrug transport system permease subunit
MLHRILAVLRARLREFYRDRASLMWNLAMPLFIVFAFAFLFSGEPEDLLKIGVLGSDHANSPFLSTDFVQFIPLQDRETAVTKVQRHQLDMLLDFVGEPRYWVNVYSAKGYVAERLLRDAYGTLGPMPVRQTVEGRDVRYVDWVMPGVLAMNMMFSCLWGVGWVVVRYRKNGVLRRLQATPLTAFEFLTAQVAARLVIISAVTLLVYVGADLVVDFTMRGSHGTLAIVLFAGAACLTSMGLIVATRLRTEELADGLLNLVSWPMLLLSGVWFSMEGTNPAAQALSQLLPLTHVVAAARRIMIDGAGLIEVLPEIGILTALTLILLGLSAWLFRWS